MTPPPLSRVKELFSAALALPPGPDRDAFLNQHCSHDLALRSHLEELLTAASQTSGLNPTRFNPASPTLSPHAPLSESPGSRIGPYKLLEQIGEGGFGVVFMAEQERPLRRRVALKIVKLGMDTRQVVARFEAERQALAMMDHPNIARVFDAGSTDSGRPYFVMELVRGIPITRYCDEHRMSIPSRLALFADVCSAVHHAHQKGIIHRDLKPNNVLVELHDGKPVPKVIDFGIAKATQSRLTDKTLFTEFRQLIGTPAYMSPEQAQLSGLDIDTRSDVYSLGVLLYELLTGSTPFDARELLSAAFDEMRRIIREVDPPAPSTRLTSTATNTASPSSLATIASSRAADPTRLTSTVRGELDWIVLKCLEKDRTRRYDSAAALATDLNHYLHDEPVSAGAPDTLYKARKFIRRHRLPVLAATAVAAALLLGTIGTTIALIGQSRANTRAQLERDRAISSEAIAKSNESRALTGEAEARKQSEEAQRQSAIAEAVVQFQSDLLSSADPTRNLGDKVTVLQAVSAAITQLNSGTFKDQPLVESRIRDTIGMTLHSLARYPEAETELRAALATRRKLLPPSHPDIAWSAGSLALTLMSRDQNAEAESLFRECLDIRRKVLPPNDPLIARADLNVAAILTQVGLRAQATPLFEEAVAIYRAAQPDNAHPELPSALVNLAGNYSNLGRFDDAETTARECIILFRRLHPPTGDIDHPSVPIALRQLAQALRFKGNFNEAEKLTASALRSTRATYPENHPSIAQSIDDHASVLLELGRYPAAESLSREGLAIQERIFGKDHIQTALQLSRLAQSLQYQQRFDEAEPLHRRIVTLYLRDRPNDAAETASVINNLATVLQQQGKFAQAEPLLRQSIDILLKDPSTSYQLAPIRGNLGALLTSLNKLPLAETELRASLDLRRKLLPPNHPDIAAALTSLANNLNLQNLPQDAEPLNREALQINLANFPPNRPKVLLAYSDSATTLARLRKFDELRTLLTRAHTDLQQTGPTSSAPVADLLARACNDLYDAERFPDAEYFLRQILTARQSDLNANPLDLAGAQHLLGRCLTAQSQYLQALAYLESALALFSKHLEENDPQLVATRTVLGRCLTGLARFPESESALLTAEQSARDAGAPPNHPLYLKTLTELTALYTAWNTASPDPALLQKAQLWQSRLTSSQSPIPPTPTTAPSTTAPSDR